MFANYTVSYSNGTGKAVLFSIFAGIITLCVRIGKKLVMPQVIVNQTKTKCRLMTLDAVTLMCSQTIWLESKFPYNFS